MSYQSINAGVTERFFTVVARATGDPITSGTVNYYLKAKSGANAGKWWRDSDQTWQASEQANAMTHEVDGHWEIDLTSSPFSNNVRYLEYVKESGDLHVPDSRHLIGAPATTGTGARTVTVTVDDGTDPLENATVSLTEGAIAYSGLTDVNGQVTFNVGDATYTVAIYKVGYTYAGSSLTVSGDATPTLSMTADVISEPADPLLATLTVKCVDESGAVESGVEIHCKISAIPTSGTGIAYDRTVQTATSGVDGNATLTVVRQATYLIKRGTEDTWKSVTIANSASTTVTSFIGSP